MTDDSEATREPHFQPSIAARIGLWLGFFWLALVLIVPAPGEMPITAWYCRRPGTADGDLVVDRGDPHTRHSVAASGPGTGAGHR